MGVSINFFLELSDISRRNQGDLQRLDNLPALDLNQKLTAIYILQEALVYEYFFTAV